MSTVISAEKQTLAPPKFRIKSGGKTFAIAIGAFRESVRDRVLYNLILFALILVGSAIFISDLSISQEVKFIADLGLSSMRVFGAFIAILVGIGLVYKEIERRTVYNLLSKPIPRSQFIIGKYLGLVLTLFVNSLVMIAATEIAILYADSGFNSLQLSILPAAYYVFLELMVIVAVALLFSTFSSPLLSALFSFSLFIVGHLSSDLLEAAKLSESAVTRTVLHGLYYLLPNLANLEFISEASHGRYPPFSLVVWNSVYVLIYVSILLSASVLIFQKRDFK